MTNKKQQQNQRRRRKAIPTDRRSVNQTKRSDVLLQRHRQQTLMKLMRAKKTRRNYVYLCVSKVSPTKNQSSLSKTIIFVRECARSRKIPQISRHFSRSGLICEIPNRFGLNQKNKKNREICGILPNENKNKTSKEVRCLSVVCKKKKQKQTSLT